jgi:hypothetical protein
MPDETNEPAVPEVPEELGPRLEVRGTLFLPEANFQVSDEGIKVVLDDVQLGELGDLFDQNSEVSAGCISRPGGPRC